MKEFELGKILSITTERLLCDMKGIYEILSYMTGETLFTHQLPRVARICKPYILKQHPQLKDINADEINTDNWEEILDKLVKLYGNTLPIEELPEDVKFDSYINPMTELEEKLGGN